jgi:peptidoglycan/LPS O-acetylase OafA/YrhL
MAAALWAVFIGSLVLSVALVAIKPSAAFYLLPSRAWEMMLGGLLVMGRFGEPTSDRAAQKASLAGYALILVPVFAYTPSTHSPGLPLVPLRSALHCLFGDADGACLLAGRSQLDCFPTASTFGICR